MQYMPSGSFWTHWYYLFDNHCSGSEIHPYVARWYTIDILRNVGAIHRAGYTHGDLKPENILMDEDGHTRLTGFGTADVDESSNWRKPLRATLAYMVPENLKHHKYRGSRKPNDIWAVGVILFALLFGYMVYSFDSSMHCRS